MEVCIKRFEELSAEELYEILKIRVAVFCIEQNCLYQDLDYKDKSAYHIYIKESGKIKAYLRVLDKGISFDEVSIGRVKKDLFFYLNQMGKLNRNYRRVSTRSGKVSAKAISGVVSADGVNVKDSSGNVSVLTDMISMSDNVAHDFGFLIN